MVTVARYFYWTPFVINKLFLDSVDHFGLLYWYNDAMEQQREIKKQEEQAKHGN